MTVVALVDCVAILVLLMAMLIQLYGLRDASAHRRFANLLYPLSQFIFIAYSMVSLYLVGEEAPYRAQYGLLLAACAVLCAVVDAALFRNLREAEDEMLYRERSEFLARQLEAQRRHFDTLLGDLQAAFRLDTQMGKQLDKMQEALERRDADGVKQLVSDVARDLPKSSTFCGHKAVDALCAVKIPAMRDAGIDCSCDISISDDCPLPSAELCALFANILDNAASACVKMPRESRWMWVHAHVVVGCLVIDERNVMAAPVDNNVRSNVRSSVQMNKGQGRRRNTDEYREATDEYRENAEEQRGRGLAEHGWGLSIIRRIVTRHGGTCSTEQGRNNDGSYWFAVHVVYPYFNE